MQFFHELLCIFLYKFEFYWHRDVEKNHSNHESKIETKLVFFTVSICGCVGSSVDVYLLAYSGAMIGWCLVKQRVFYSCEKLVLRHQLINVAF